jgi:hypothetical protein
VNDSGQLASLQALVKHPPCAFGDKTQVEQEKGSKHLAPFARKASKHICKCVKKLKRAQIARVAYRDIRQIEALTSYSQDFSQTQIKKADAPPLSALSTLDVMEKRVAHKNELGLDHGSQSQEESFDAFRDAR